MIGILNRAEFTIIDTVACMKLQFSCNARNLKDGNVHYAIGFVVLWKECSKGMNLKQQIEVLHSVMFVFLFLGYQPDLLVMTL